MYTSIRTNDLFDTMFSDFDRLMNSPRFSYGETFPPMNIFYNKKEQSCTIQVATAGYSKDELGVSVNGRELIITGTPKEDKTSDDIQYLRNKLHKMTFERTYTLPDGYDFSQTKVSYKDGLLTITIPLVEKKSSKQSIMIED